MKGKGKPVREDGMTCYMANRMEVLRHLVHNQ